MSDKTEFVEVKCFYCKTKFKKTRHRYKEAVKNNWKFYCSKRCNNLSKNTSIQTKCNNCNKTITLKKCHYEKSKSKSFFCSKTCAAIFNNKLRGPKTFDEKEKIRQGIISYHKRKGTYDKYQTGKTYPFIKNCSICGKKFKASKPSRICCSKKCGYIYQLGSLPYTKEDVLNGILNKFKELSRTPQKRDCISRLASAASRLFGTWNKAIKECGLKPNSSKYQRTRLKCLDGDISDSISEKIVDDWFHENGMSHVRNKKYPESNCDCDFYFPNYDLWVEYFGLIGQDKEYDKTVKRKRKLIKKNNLKFIAIIPGDLYPKIRMDKIFKNYV